MQQQALRRDRAIETPNGKRGSMESPDLPWVLEAQSITKTYADGQERRVLDDVSIRIPRGGFVALRGPSGSGKSTLLSILGTLDTVYTGTVRVAGEDVRKLSDDELARLRRTHIGFVFQQFSLLPDTNAMQNVELPLIFAGMRRAERRARVLEALTAVSMQAQARQAVSHMSGGERQRVAIARALVARPDVLLADEPTGSLDSTNGAQIIEMLQQLRRERSLSVLMVTHDESVARAAETLYELRDGHLREVCIEPLDARQRGHEEDANVR